jgi:hypothetical protein
MLLGKMDNSRAINVFSHSATDLMRSLFCCGAAMHPTTTLLGTSDDRLAEWPSGLSTGSCRRFRCNPRGKAECRPAELTCSPLFAQRPLFRTLIQTRAVSPPPPDHQLSTSVAKNPLLRFS